MSEIRRYMTEGGWSGTELVHYLTWAVLSGYGSSCGLEGDKSKRTFSATSEEERVTCPLCKLKLEEFNAKEAAARLAGTHEGKAT